VPDRLVDMSEMVATGATFQLAILAARARGVQKFPNDFRSALVSPRVEVTGFAHIFRNLNRNPQITLKVFGRVEAAEGVHLLVCRGRRLGVARGEGHYPRPILFRVSTLPAVRCRNGCRDVTRM